VQKVKGSRSIFFRVKDEVRAPGRGLAPGPIRLAPFVLKFYLSILFYFLIYLRKGPGLLGEWVYITSFF
jgi:hypothetical protein